MDTSWLEELVKQENLYAISTLEAVRELEKDLALTNQYADSVHRENNSLRSDLAEANELVDAYRLMEKEWRRIDGERRLLDAHVSTSCQ